MTTKRNSKYWQNCCARLQYSRHILQHVPSEVFRSWTLLKLITQTNLCLQRRVDYTCTTGCYACQQSLPYIATMFWFSWGSQKRDLHSTLFAEIALKIYERVIERHIRESFHIQENQFGFMPGSKGHRSCYIHFVLGAGENSLWREITNNTGFLWILRKLLIECQEKSRTGV